MSAHTKRRATDKVSIFSIGFKLIGSIILIVGVCLFVMIIIVSKLVKNDLRIEAETNILEVNERLAAEVEYTLRTTRSESMLLLQALDGMGAGGTAAHSTAQNTIELYFEQNPQVAALFFIFSGKTDDLLINEPFFQTRSIEPSWVESYREDNRKALSRAAWGETVLLNAAPFFLISTPLVAFFFPCRDGAAAVLFSPSNLEVSFGYGVNQSCLINDAGDILIHADYEQIRAGTNIAGDHFIQLIWEDQEQSKQSEYIENGKKFFKAFTKLNLGGCTVTSSIEENIVFEQIDATSRRYSYLTGAVLCISMLFIWFFAKSISVPLKTLAVMARIVEGGSFEKVKLNPGGRDEIGLLTVSFQRMCRALGIFGKFTNRQIAIKAMRSEIKPGGLPKHATIFFSDIRNFTAASEKFTMTFGDEASDRIVRWLNDYLTRMIECVEKTGGVVDKFIGDAVMAHWGTAYTSGSPQEDAFNCVKAALMMRKALYEMNKSRAGDDSGNPPIRIGCGINTGIVTAGQIGSEIRMEYTVIGDPVNLASRVESLNKPLGTDILITEDTWNMVKHCFITEEMPAVTVKGKVKPVRIFAVVNFAGINQRPQTLADVRRLLGIEAPDITKVDVNADERKYKIGAKE